MSGSGSSSARGRFITFEGGEGAGKSTQVGRLASALRAGGLSIVATREPGGSLSGEIIRRLLVEGDPGRWLPATEALLHFAARVEHLHHTIRPALGTGQWVVCDRFADSTMAYQGYGGGAGREMVEALYRTTIGAFAPDLTLILDVPVDVGLARAAARAGVEDRYERMDRGFHERLRSAFLNIAQREPQRCVVIDATRDADAIERRVRAVVSERLAVRMD